MTIAKGYSLFDEDELKVIACKSPCIPLIIMIFLVFGISKLHVDFLIRISTLKYLYLCTSVFCLSIYCHSRYLHPHMHLYQLVVAGGILNTLESVRWKNILVECSS